MTKRGAVGAFVDEGRASRIPGCVAARLEGGPQAAGGEGAGIGLAADQFFAAEFRDGFAVGDGGEEAVVLFGGQAGHGLEHMREVGGSFFHRPVFHGGGDVIGDGGIEDGALLDGLLQGLVNRLGEALPLDFFIEDIGAKEILQVRFLEVDAIELVLGARDGLNRLTAEVA